MKEKLKNCFLFTIYKDEIVDVIKYGNQIKVQFSEFDTVTVDYDEEFFQFLNEMKKLRNIINVNDTYEKHVLKKTKLNLLYTSMIMVPMLGTVLAIKFDKNDRILLLLITALIGSILNNARVLTKETFINLINKEDYYKNIIDECREIMYELLNDKTHSLHTKFITEQELEYVVLNFIKNRKKEIKRTDEVKKYIKKLDLEVLKDI